MSRSSAAPITEAVVVAVGDELLAGAHPDLNAPELAQALGPLGIAVREVRVVSDDVDAIAAAVRAGAARARLVLVSGGLGPTLDDVTRDGIARAAAVELETDADAIAGLEAWYGGRGLAMPESNRRQALFPKTATIVRNEVGTAPGFRVLVDGAWVVSLPGPPRELRYVLREEILPWLTRTGLAGAPLLERKLYLFGVPESVFAERAGAWMGRDADPLISCSAKQGALWITLRGVAPDPALASARLAERVADLRNVFGPAVYSEREPRIELALGRALVKAGISIATAESCTGGLVAGLLTETPGISAAFSHGFITYANDAKVELLGVERETLARYGAVSEEVAVAMARGAARAAGARLAVAVTGVAGPAGGTAEKPVGLVWFATELDGVVESFQREFPAFERTWVRAVAARTALHRSWLRLRERGLLPVEEGGQRIVSAD